MYVSGHVDIFDMVDIDLFTVVALNLMVLKLGYTGKSKPMFYNYLRPLTSLDEGLYALACEEDVRCLATFVRSFKLIEVCIEHGVTSLDSYLRAPRFRATLEEITDEPGSIAANIIEKMLLLTWHESSETSKEPVCDYVIPSSFPQHDLSTPCKDSVSTVSQVIDDVIRQLSFDETELDREVGFADVAGSGVDSSVETQSELLVSKEPDVGRTQEPILAEVRTQEPIVAEGNGQEDESAPTDGQFFYDDEGIDTTYKTEYDVQSSEDAGIDDDDDVDEDFLVDEENEIVEPYVDVHLFGISIDLPFDNIGVTNLVSDDVLEGDDVDVINGDGFDSDPEAKDRVYLHSIESKRNLKLYKNDGARIRARCDGKVPVFTMSQGRAKYDLLLNNICEVFNGKIVGGRDKPVITLLEYIRGGWLKRNYLIELQSERSSFDDGGNGIEKELSRFIVSLLLHVVWNMAINERVAFIPRNVWSKFWEEVLTCPTNNFAITTASCPGSGRQGRKGKERLKHEDEHICKAPTLLNLQVGTRGSVDQVIGVVIGLYATVVHGGA
ncbi:hypothetical protein Tco_0003430 [Tanacetum coccineum]